jgi:2-dehydropantoate 2-reductase
MTLGSLDGDQSYKTLIEQAFSQTNYRIRYSENMDTWLKCHAAFVLPICFICYYSDGHLKKIAGDKVILNRIIDAIDEAYRIVETCGYPIEPAEDGEFVRRHCRKYYMTLKLMAATLIGTLAASDHAMTARDEMRRLYDDFCILKTKAGITTSAWDVLAQYMERA